MSLNFANPNTLVDTDIFADIMSVSKATLLKWEANGKIKAINHDNKKKYSIDDIAKFPEIIELIQTRWNEELGVRPVRSFKSIELFAGAGGLALGLEKAGFEAILLNEYDRHACNTLRINRPNWNILETDIHDIDFTSYQDVDFISGGFPCQAFSYAGNHLGFSDTRGTLFFEFARAIKEVRPKVFLGENVRGLLEHDQGRTLKTIRSIIAELGYTLIEPRVLRALFYQVPQKRERLFLVGIRNDVLKFAQFSWPAPCNHIYVLRDALKAGDLFATDVPESPGQSYPRRKAEILDLVPPGGYWRDLPDELQREYMQGSYFLGGGKTGMARRLSWDAPSLTLTCAPAQKQTERCHPEESRPLTVREYARIQTFPDEWVFTGPLASQYKQIGNAVPVNLAFAMGRRLIALLNTIDQGEVIPPHQQIISPLEQLTLLSKTQRGQSPVAHQPVLQ